MTKFKPLISGQRKLLTVLFVAASLAGCASNGADYERQLENEKMRIQERVRNQEIQLKSAELQRALRKAREDAEYARQNPGFFSKIFGG